MRKLIPVTVMVRVTNIKEKRAGKKKKNHTQRITLFIIHRDKPSPVDTNLYY